MDKKALQAYAVWAKNNLESQIEVSLKTLGINSEKDIKTARKVGEYTIIDGDSHSYPGDLKSKRDKIVNLIKQDGYKQTIEEFAYTWFNRIVALRFMEVHDFLPHGFRVLSNRTGGSEPEILKNLNFVKDDLRLNMSVLSPLMEQGKLDESFRYVLFRQCNALSGILPMLFESDDDYLELLLPKALLKGETFITKLLEIDESEFLNDVEVIGWLYQFYISQKKDEVSAAKKTITKDTLPAVTQLFTPDWIVRYMAENSVGRMWLESYPTSALKSQMKYYVEDAKQETEVQRKIDAIKYSNVNPENIRIVEPCCGSGHILVYVFDLLQKMYEERGYAAREIPSLILKKNLVGLDVDKRAAQLASFSLIMKARSVNSRFFNDNYYTIPQVYEIWDSRALFVNDYKTHLQEMHLLSSAQIKELEWLAETFRYGKTIGSLLKVDKKDFEAISASLDLLEKNGVRTIFNVNFFTDGIKCLRHLVKQAEVLSDKYDVMITNPPYIGISSMEEPVKDYAIKYYPNSKSDMFAMFMETGFVKANGFLAMINMHSWMFLSSYEKLRKEILMTKEIVNMVHLGAHAFEAIGGEVVQTTSFVVRNANIGGNGVYFRLVDSKDKEKDFVDNLKNSGGGRRFVANKNIFETLPGNAFIYWLSEAMFAAFQKGTCLSEMANPKQGLATGKNDQFVRLWYEVNREKSFYTATDSIQAFYTGKKWFPYNKGGSFRKWYGNNDCVVNWENNGKEIINFKGSVIRNPNYYFFEAISWSKIASGPIAFRYKPSGHIFDVAGCSIFCEHDQLLYLLGAVNSKVVMELIKAVAPTLNYEVGQVAGVPIIVDTTENVKKVVIKNIDISKQEWDSFEESWDFKKHPLI